MDGRDARNRNVEDDAGGRIGLATLGIVHGLDGGAKGTRGFLLSVAFDGVARIARSVADICIGLIAHRVDDDFDHVSLDAHTTTEDGEARQQGILGAAMVHSVLGHGVGPVRRARDGQPETVQAL